MSPKTVLYRCDAGNVPEIGTGHFRRCVRIAEALRDVVHDHVFLMRDLPGRPRHPNGSGIRVTTFRDDEREAMLDAFATMPIDLVVLDVLSTSKALIDTCLEAGIKVISLDDRGAGLAADVLTINAIMEHPRADYGGPAYIVLSGQPAEPQEIREVKTDLRVVASFGGYDHRRLADQVVDVVTSRPEVGHLTIVGHEEPASAAPHQKECQISWIPYTSEFSTVLAEADIAIISGGLTLFEAMAVGTPAIVIPQYGHQVETAERYASKGACVLTTRTVEHDFRAELGHRLHELAEPGRRALIGRRGRELVDGAGLDRIRSIIETILCPTLQG